MLDDEPLMSGVEGAPRERTHLPHSKPRLSHYSDQRTSAEALVGSRGAVEFAGDGEELGELVFLEKATGWPIRLEAPVRN